MTDARLTRRELAAAIADIRRFLDEPSIDTEALLEVLDGYRGLHGGIWPPKALPDEVRDDVHAALDLIDGARRALAAASKIARGKAGAR